MKRSPRSPWLVPLLCLVLVSFAGPAALGARRRAATESEKLLEAKLRVLVRTEAELAEILTDLEASPTPETRDALVKLRERANSIAARITHRLNEDAREDAVSLSEARRDPDPDEFVPFDEPPRLLTMQAPVYPSEALHERREGLVLVRVLVGVDGRVKKTILIQSVPGLDQTALASARSAHFEPARRGDEPVAVWMMLPIEFTLASEE